MKQYFQDKESFMSKRSIFTFANKLDISEQRYIEKIQEELNRYKELEESGHLKIFPCKAGDTVWNLIVTQTIDYPDGKFQTWDVVESRVESLISRNKKDEVWMRTKEATPRSCVVGTDRFHELVFFSSEEAFAKRDELNQESLNQYKTQSLSR